MSNLSHTGPEFTMFRYYHGQADNPFDNATENVPHMFWFYESIFEDIWTKYESSDWYAFFKDYGTGDQLMKILTDADHDRPGIDKKKAVFELWLEYLFTFKLYPEYGGENRIQALYYSHTTAV